MLQFIREYDYSPCAAKVAELHSLAKFEVAEPVSIPLLEALEFFRSAVEIIGTKLNSCNNTNEYDRWCHSKEARKIVCSANSVLHNIELANISCVARQVRACAEDVAYLVSSKCATFYNED